MARKLDEKDDTNELTSKRKEVKQIRKADVEDWCDSGRVGAAVLTPVEQTRTDYIGVIASRQNEQNGSA